MPFYIGKGKSDRWKSRSDRSVWWNNYTNKHGFIPRILVEGLDNQTACEIEKQYIEKYGFIKNGGLLINQTLGGEGGNTFDPIGGKNWNSGKTGIYKPEVIAKMKAARMGKKLDPAIKEKVLVGLRKGLQTRLKNRLNVLCLKTGKIWANYEECMNDLNISRASVKQMLFLKTKIQYIKK